MERSQKQWLEMQFNWQSACLAGSKPWVPKPQHHMKRCVVVRGYNVGTWEIEAERLEVQGHSWLRGEFEASLDCINLLSKQTKTKTNKQN